MKRITLARVFQLQKDWGLDREEQKELLALAEFALVASPFFRKHGEEVSSAFEEAMDGEADEEARDEMRETARAYKLVLNAFRELPQETREELLDGLVDDLKVALEKETADHAETSRTLTQCKNTLSAMSRENAALRESARLVAQQITAMSESAIKWAQIKGAVK